MEMKKHSIMLFHFSSIETVEDLCKRLAEKRKIGISQILASYQTQGMQPEKFDQKYFTALDKLVQACEETDMQFWLEDYAPFPTGNANGAFQKEEYEQLNKIFIDERHIDICGSMHEAVIRIDDLQNAVFGKSMYRFSKVDPSNRKRLCVVAFQIRTSLEETAAVYLLEETAVVLDQHVENGFLKWNVPEGYWRIFVIFQTYESSGRAYYMNLLSEESVKLEIEMVHRPICEHLKNKCGTIWKGFFYDEPEIGNAGGESVFDYYMLPGRRTLDTTDCNVYPWSSEMPEEMGKRDPDWKKKLPYLWYDGNNTYRTYRCNYMDAVSLLVQKNYNGQVYAFCKDNNIGYFGHVLEDENCHTRLGCGPGHYFRQQYYQDVSGIDVIAGQILPGRDGAISWPGVVNADGEFYHYGLAKLASSEAHINPLKRNRAAAECFAMYGQQGGAERKFLIDHLMVNGITNFLFFDDLSTYDAPVKYAELLVRYTDQMCSLLHLSKPMIKAAVLYHAETEWRYGKQAQKFQKIGAVLARNQISYDVIPEDIFSYPERYGTDMKDGLSVNGNKYEALIIPACTELSEVVVMFVKQCIKTGFPVFFTDTIPEGQNGLVEENVNINKVLIADMADELIKTIKGDIFIKSPNKKWIRYSRVMRGEDQYYLIHNETPEGKTECELVVEADNDIFIWDIAGELWIFPKQERMDAHHVKLQLSFEKYEMKVLCSFCGQNKPETFLSFEREEIHENKWEIEFPDGRVIYAHNGNLPCLARYLGYDFYGKIIYRTIFVGREVMPQVLDLGNVSDYCEVFLNGESIGKRFASPYVYDVRKRIQTGENELTVEVYPSGGNIKNPAEFSGIKLDELTAMPYTLVEPMGFTGTVKWIY